MRRLVGLVVVASCASGPDDRPRTLEYITDAIFVPYCGRGGCHSTNTAASHIILDTVANARFSIMDRGLVVPGKPGQSELFDVISTTRRQMPPDQPLPDPDVELIRQWILDGAEGL